MSSETAILELGHHASSQSDEADRVISEGDDTDLMRRAQQGDTAAFEALLRLHERTVFGTAWRLLGTVEDAQDAAQEVFLRLYRYLGSVDPRRPLRPWLYRVTVNVCRDLGRKRQLREALPLHDATQLTASDTDSDPTARTALGEERHIVKKGLEVLTPKERAALVLRDLEGLSTGEVAKALQSSETTVRSHICRARLKLKSFRDRWKRTRK